MEILTLPFQLASRQSRRVRQIREEAHPQDDRLLGRDRGGHGEKGEKEGSHGWKIGLKRTTQLIYDYIS